MGRLVIMTGLAVASVVVVRYLRAEPASILDAVWTTLRHRGYQFVVLALLVLNLRTILFRLTERDVKPRGPS